MDQYAREKENLYRFEAGEVAADFWKTEDKAESYFTQYPQREYLMEYYFETASQFKAMLDALWESEACMQGMVKTLVAATIKSKPLKAEDFEMERKYGMTEQLPEFIYNF